MISPMPTVSFELDCGHQLNTGTAACAYSYRFQSVMGKGIVRFIDERNEKRKALAAVMEHYTAKSDWTFPEAAIDDVSVYQLEVSEISCKEHL